MRVSDSTGRNPNRSQILHEQYNSHLERCGFERHQHRHSRTWPGTFCGRHLHGSDSLCFASLTSCRRNSTGMEKLIPICVTSVYSRASAISFQNGESVTSETVVDSFQI